jgi:hypothetical protein
LEKALRIAREARTPNIKNPKFASSGNDEQDSSEIQETEIAVQIN